MADKGRLGGAWYDVGSIDTGRFGGVDYSANAIIVAPGSSDSLILNRAFPTASDRRLFPIFTGRAFPTD